MTPDTLHVRILTEGDGPPLLMLHGSVGPRVLEPLRALLAKRFRLIVPTLPGFLPGDGVVEYSDDALVVFVENVRQSVGVDRLPVFGFGLGGRAAVNYALAHRDRVERLILAAPAGLYTPKRSYAMRILRALAERRLTKTLASPAQAEQYLLRNIADAGSQAGTLMSAIAREQFADADVRRSVARAHVGAHTEQLDWPSRLRKLDVPALLFWSSDDSVCPVRYGRSLGRMLPDAELEVLWGYRHLAVAEQPEFFADHITPFLGGGKQQGKSLPML